MIEDRLTSDWLGRPLADLLDQDVAAQLLAAPSGAIVLQPLTGRSERFDAIAHRLGPFVVVELEPASAATLTGSQILLTLDAASVTFERATDLRDLGERAAATFARSPALTASWSIGSSTTMRVSSWPRTESRIWARS